MGDLREAVCCVAGRDVSSAKTEVCVCLINYGPISIKYSQSSSVFFPALYRYAQHNFPTKCYIIIYKLLNIIFVLIFSTKFSWTLKVM